MVLNQTELMLCLVSQRAPFLVLYCSPCNDISANIESKIRLFEGERVFYREIKDKEDQ